MVVFTVYTVFSAQIAKSTTYYAALNGLCECASSVVLAWHEMSSYFTPFAKTISILRNWSQKKALELIAPIKQYFILPALLTWTTSRRGSPG